MSNGIDASLDGVLPEEIRSTPTVIRDTLDIALPRVEQIVDAIGLSPRRRIFLIGNGSQYYVAQYNAALSRRVAGPEDPVTIPMKGREFTEFRPRLGRRDVVIGLSTSGECQDVVGAIRDIRGAVTTIGITPVADSSLAGAADHVILPTGARSRATIKTRSFPASLAATALTVTALIDGPLRAMAVGLRLAANDAERAIASAELVVGQIAAELITSRHVFVVGHALAFPAALQSALLLKQIAILHAEASDTWEMRSGASTVAGPRDTIIALVPEGNGGRDSADIVRILDRWGVTQVVEVGERQSMPGSRLLPLPRGVDDLYAPLVMVPPVSLLAVALGRLRGEDPDNPRWIKRYQQQGMLRHVINA